MIFAIFNNGYRLGECSGMIKDAFQYQTEDERANEFEDEIVRLKKLGWFKDKS